MKKVEKYVLAVMAIFLLFILYHLYFCICGKKKESRAQAGARNIAEQAKKKVQQTQEKPSKSSKKQK